MLWNDPIPVTFGPHIGDWAIVIATIVVGLVAGAIALLGVAASTGVAIMAWRTSESAKEIAEQGNKVQREIHEERLKTEYAMRLDDALANLFRAMQMYFDPLRKWIHDAERVEASGRVDPLTDDLAYPPDPSMDSIRAEIEVLQLVARGDDAVMAADIRDTLGRVQTMYPNPRWQGMLEVIDSTSRWRTGQISSSKAHQRLAELRLRATA